ncbi:MAG: major facilitator superfamily protein [Clostridiales bacterium]|jgi:MFS family permease|nr:major facilitator superfamily protein [Clostridiales bacterium]
MKNMREYFKPYKGLPISIYVIFFASIVNNMGNFVAPFLTMFLTRKFGISAEIVGIVVAINSALGMIGAMIGGKLIDQVGRKKVLIIFRTLSGIAIAAAAFLNDPISITSLIMLSTLFGGFSQPVYSTMITDLTEGEQRKAGFSLEYMAINIGFSVGPLLAGFLFENYLTWLFLGDAITTFTSIALVAAFVPETIPSREKLMGSKPEKLESAEEGSLLSAMLKRPTLVIFSLIMVIYFIVFSQFNFGLSIQVSDIFKNNSSAIFGTLMTVNALMCSILTVFITSTTKNIGASLSISIGGVLYAIGFGMIFFINSHIMFIISTIIWTLGEIMVSTNTSVYIADHTPITHRGRFNSVFPIIRKLGFIVGPLLAGIFVKLTNIKSLWILVGVLSIIAGAMMYRLYSMDRLKETVGNLE